MEKESKIISIKAADHWCIFCALEDGLYINATRIVFDENDHKALPVCDKCFDAMNDSNFFRVFSLN